MIRARSTEMEPLKQLAKIQSDQTLNTPPLSKHRLKMVIIGDGAVGKSSLIKYYLSKEPLANSDYTVLIINSQQYLIMLVVKQNFLKEWLILDYGIRLDKMIMLA